ncbi:hypothetical protein EDEG_00867 [Edhazardia aedis USNM 41457]|uniref:sn-1-specific diacylglycerol lipase n=1 Tax=Edhazardia aedis (strain USNM 41457) TaxID=1003232 RepID=J9DUR2_EDHAE|nr:hypothetical protein EDEG_00867 [Edhazardia aedis USNM 41457]|eukprot:EJW05032.1 hypothetical protein EDEG_00867 [Edhazardia aedis USNM 41457]
MFQNDKNQTATEISSEKKLENDILVDDNKIKSKFVGEIFKEKDVEGEVNDLLYPNDRKNHTGNNDNKPPNAEIDSVESKNSFTENTSFDGIIRKESLNEKIDDLIANFTIDELDSDFFIPKDFSYESFCEFLPNNSLYPNYTSNIPNNNITNSIDVPKTKHVFEPVKNISPNDKEDFNHSDIIDLHISEKHKYSDFLNDNGIKDTIDSGFSSPKDANLSEDKFGCYENHNRVQSYFNPNREIQYIKSETFVDKTQINMEASELKPLTSNENKKPLSYETHAKHMCKEANAYPLKNTKDFYTRSIRNLFIDNEHISDNQNNVSTLKTNRSLSINNSEDNLEILTDDLHSDSISPNIKSPVYQYSILNKQWFEYYLNKFYYAISSYSNPIMLKFVPIRREVSNKIHNDERKILEMINKDRSQLLSYHKEDVHDSVPNVIFYDEIENEIVVSFRGTQSHKDALKDLDCEYIRFFSGFGHSGFIKQATKFVKHQLNLLKYFCDKKKTKNVLLCGQSLGGAIATIIYIIITEKNLMESYNFRVISFSAPPTLSENICQNLYPNITNIVYGHDIVPRLSFGSGLDFKYTCISMNNSKKDAGNYQNRYSIIKKYLYKNDLYPKLYIPGKIFHLKKSYQGKDESGWFFNNDADSIIVVAEVEYPFFGYINVHLKTIIHHMFSSTINAFNDGIKQAKKREVTKNVK